MNAILLHAEVDPFLEWLGALPKWDGLERLANLLPTLFGADDDALSHWGGRYLFLGTVQRTLEPGCKLDEILVLIGPQGVGKSALLRSTLPPDIPGLFSDGLRWDAQARDQVDAILGRAIVEASEMAGRSRAEVEHIKAFVSRQDDGHVRRPYAVHTEESPRRFIVVGTTNEETDLPNDPSGLRRFVPVRVKKSNGSIEDFMHDWRGQYWSEALVLYERGERANLPRKLIAMQAERAELFRDRDDLIEDAVAALLVQPMTMAQVMSKLPGCCAHMSQQRIGRALRNAGWSKGQVRDVQKRKVRKWIPPR